MTTLRISFLLTSISFLALGCNDSHPIGEHDSGIIDTDGGGGETCGSVTCGAGEVCCNASCGICAAPDEGCIAIACADGGTLPDASFCIECAAPPPGCHWEGASCETCGTLVCDGTCGGLTPDGTPMCGTGEYCDYPSGCGFADGSGTCRPRPDACPTVYIPVCGCDGNTYSNECTAASAGIDVYYSGECDSGPCAAMDARGSGMCAAFFGYAWNGTSCMGLSGCSCVGADCGAAFDSMEACEAAYAHCGGTTCGTIAGLGCGMDEWCDYDGMSCGFADEGGVCRPRPEACPELYSPVCGCDGTTYGNSCEAQAAGRDVAYTGECTSPPPTDCRATGCPMGQYCSGCRTAGGGVAYVCIPDGAAC